MYLHCNNNYSYRLIVVIHCWVTKTLTFLVNSVEVGLFSISELKRVFPAQSKSLIITSLAMSHETRLYVRGIIISTFGIIYPFRAIIFKILLHRNIIVCPLGAPQLIILSFRSRHLIVKSWEPVDLSSTRTVCSRESFLCTIIYLQRFAFLIINNECWNPIIVILILLFFFFLRVRRTSSRRGRRHKLTTCHKIFGTFILITFTFNFTGKSRLNNYNNTNIQNTEIIIIVRPVAHSIRYV